MEHPVVMVKRDAPSLGTALGRAMELGQRLATDQVQLLRLEFQDLLQRAVRKTVWLSIGSQCLLAAWICLVAAAVVGLEGRLSLDARLALAATVQVVLGLGLIVWGTRARGERA
jgi:putative superfamily III holin-X